MAATILRFPRKTRAPAKRQVSGAGVVVDLATFREAKRRWAWIKDVIERGRRKAEGGAV